MIRKISKGKVEELNKEKQKPETNEKAEMMSAWVIALDVVMVTPVTNKL